MKIMTHTLLLPLAFALILPGCTNTAETAVSSMPTPSTQPASLAPAPLTAEQQITGDIKIMVPGGLNHTTFLEVLKVRFTEKHPGTNVILETTAENEMEKKISSGDVPDIWIGSYFQPAKYAKEKLILDLKRFPGSTELFNRIAPQYIHEDAGGGIFYVPWYATTQLMIYNKELFREAGLDPEKPPRTFEQYLEYAKKINALPKRADGSKVYGNNFPNIDQSASAWDWTLISPVYYNINGAKYGLFNDTGTDIVFDKPESGMAEFFKFMKEAHKYAPENSANANFNRRDIGMSLQFGYYWWDYDLNEAKGKPMVIGQDVGIAPLPTLREGDPSWSTLEGKTLMIFKSDPAKESLAWEFIKFLMQDDNYLLTVKSIGPFPTLKSVESNPYFQTPERKPFIDQLKNVKPKEAAAQLDEISNIVLETYTRFLMNPPKLTAEDAIKQAAEKARTKLANVKDK